MLGVFMIPGLPVDMWLCDRKVAPRQEGFVEEGKGEESWRDWRRGSEEKEIWGNGGRGR